MTRWIKWLGWPIGIAILLALVVHEGAGDAVRVIGQAGFALLWLVPFHGLPLLLDAHAWRLLLDKRASLPFLWWIATVREAVNRLLPVVGVGGEIVGIRLARWRVPDASRVTASVIVEVLVTIAVQYAFAALGLVLLLAATQESVGAKTIGVALALSLPIPVLGFVLMRRGGVFHAIERFAGRLLGDSHRLLQGVDGKRLDADIDALMSRAGLLFRAFFWQLAGYVAGALEILLGARDARPSDIDWRRDRDRGDDAGGAPCGVHGAGRPRRPGGDRRAARADVRRRPRGGAVARARQARARVAVRRACARIVAGRRAVAHAAADSQPREASGPRRGGRGAARARDGAVAVNARRGRRAPAFGH